MKKNCDFFSGRVAPEKIEEQILSCQQLGLSVFFVGITAGTTVLGAFDPIEEVAQICRKYKIWLHVDVNCDLLHLFQKTRSLYLGSMGWFSIIITKNQAFSSRY